MTGDGGEHLAPVTYLPGAHPPRVEPVKWAVPLHDLDAPAETAGRESQAVSDGRDTDDDEPEADSSPAAVDAEEALARRLRRSALSEREARTFLAQRAVGSSVVEDTIAHFVDRRWLDDAALAEQLVYAGTSRKGQGRRAIAQALSGRGIPRDVADAALDALPDDDSDRALEYARTKAHGLRSYDVDTAVRRLVGQLSRRGYPGSVAAHAARTAIDELRGSSKGGVQFR